jgi:FG-GAP-like repeat/TPR repeat/ASPIC and UnbV/Tetratricopeptide repeat
MGFVACESRLPDPSSDAYTQAVAAFYRGLAAAQAGETGLADAAFQRFTELAPGEPAGWANYGLVALQRREMERAAGYLQQARRLAPDNTRLLFIAALVAHDRGDLDAAVADLQRAVELDPENPRVLYLLAQVIEQRDGPEAAVEALRQIDRILVVRPGNLVGLVERARLAATLHDLETLRQTLDRIDRRADSVFPSVIPEVQTVRAAAATGDLHQTATQIAFLQAALQPLPTYQDDADVVVTSPSRMDALLTGFVRLSNAVAQTAAADTTITFQAESLVVAEGPMSWVRALWLSEEAPLAVLARGSDTVWISPAPELTQPIAFPGGSSPSTTVVASLDYDDDFRIDLALAGTGGLRLLHQETDGSFVDVTRDLIPAGVARTPFAGVWSADIDLEGDLDIVLAPIEGTPLVLRNRGNGSFESYPEFSGVTRLRDFVWADLDADGDPDAALLDATGRLQVFSNERASVPHFQPFQLPDSLGSVAAMSAADTDHNSTVELIVLRSTGTVSRLSLADGDWRIEELARWPDFSPPETVATRLQLADLDNNGDLDVVASTSRGTRVWLGGTAGMHSLTTIDLSITSIADLNSDGRLDLLGITSDGTPRLFANRGSLDYYSTTILTRAAQATGDRRINSFGFGGDVEVRAGLLYQKRLISDPPVHVGLGNHPQVDVVRITWPNGSVQAEFNVPAANETIMTRQRLKGSCPWVFTFNGEQMQFVTDFIWRTALGLRINAQGDALVIHSEDWIKIRGGQMAPRDGIYDVRITADLWETHFFDYIALMVVDHPVGTEVFVDERFILPAPQPRLYTTGPLHSVAQAWDNSGRDVTSLISQLDERFLDTFALGRYQGVASDHYVEIALGDDAPMEGPLWLVASGWVYPTDASINVAISQGDEPAPHGLRLEVPAGNGGWTTVEPDLGFPSGKTKTILIDLQHAFRAGTPRRVRLRTNVEVYWDRIAWAAGRPDTPVNTRRLLPASAELRYRGFSQTAQAGRRAPEIPDYNNIGATGPQWLGLVGFYTRYGDVRPLIETVDDRYPIMAAGDELALRFDAPPPPDDGWTRDYVLIGDGWVKDGDYNTGFSTTVQPLPYHGLADYVLAPGRLEDDPAYRRHPNDWIDYHTRYLTPKGFQRALVPNRDR